MGVKKSQKQKNRFNIKRKEHRSGSDYSFESDSSSSEDSFLPIEFGVSKHQKLKKYQTGISSDNQTAHFTEGHKSK
jgi:hypothetical protein